MKAKMDGNMICVTTDYFVNLQESAAVFLEADDRVGLAVLDGEALDFDDRLQIYELLADGAAPLDCPNWGRMKAGPLEGFTQCEECGIYHGDEVA